MAWLWIIEYSVARVSPIAAQGFDSLMTTELLAPALTLVTDAQNTWFWPIFGSRNRLKSSTTLALVHGAPEWNLTLSRILSVKVRLSVDAVQDSKRAGTILPWKSRIIANSYSA